MIYPSGRRATRSEYSITKCNVGVVNEFQITSESNFVSLSSTGLSRDITCYRIWGKSLLLNCLSCRNVQRRKIRANISDNNVHSCRI